MLVPSLGTKCPTYKNHTDPYVTSFLQDITPPKNIKDVKNVLTKAPKEQETEIARTIKVEKSGITLGSSFIPTARDDVKVLTVRLTAYWSRGGDTDSDSRKCRSSTGYTLRQGDSIAVDPRIIPYGTDVIIPNVGLVKAVDTGTAVKDKTASGGKLPVIDVFFVNKKDALKFANTYPKIVKVAVLN